MKRSSAVLVAHERAERGRALGERRVERLEPGIRLACRDSVAFSSSLVAGSSGERVG
jgi:hypothetical protein